MATDADEETTACIARLLHQDAIEAAWVRGESPERRKKSDSSDDDDYAPSGAQAKRKKASAPKPAPAPKEPKAPKAPAAAAKPRSAGGEARGLTLGDLIRAKVLRPGPGAITTVYKGNSYAADLGPSGMIHFRGAFFQNVSAWSLHVKRLTAPERKADDGWHCVRHGGKLLHDLKADAAAALGLRPGGEGAADADAADVDAAAAAAPAVTPAEATIPAPPPAAAAAPKPPKAQPPAASPPRAGSPDAAPPMSTEYARARPQRERREPQRLAPNISDTAAHVLDADDLVLVDCVPYDAAGAPDAPPPPVAALRVSASAALLMDFHAHLSTAEVIGFLGGTWCAASRQLRVLRALPAAQLVSGDAAVEVEVDPSCMPGILEALEAEGLTAVGWYHSHPTFATQPSVRDIGNQGAYERLFAGVPFVGAIVGPWAAADEGGVADVRWFHVTAEAGAPGGARPRQLAPLPLLEEQEGAADAPPPPQLRASLEQEAAAQAARFAGSLLRTDFGGTWRAGCGSRRDKLAASLRARLPRRGDAAQGEALIKRMLAALDQAWLRC